MLIHPPDVELVRIRVLDGNSCKGPTSQRPYRCTSAGKNGSIEFQIAWTHHQAITRTHANFSLLRVCGIHTRKVSERLFSNQHGSDIVKTFSWEKQKHFLSHIAMVCYWSVLHYACHIPGILHTVWWVLCSMLLVDLTICFSVLSIAIQYIKQDIERECSLQFVAYFAMWAAKTMLQLCYNILSRSSISLCAEINTSSKALTQISRLI